MSEPGPSGIVSKCDYSSLIQNSNENTEFKSDLLQQLKDEFNTEEQSIFVNSFYAYLNHHPTDDFIIDLDIVCKFIGFTRKDHLKKLLLKNFSEVTDYQILLPRGGEQVRANGGAGLNKETIMINVDTFKGLCMLARTEQAKIIRTYYIKLESIVMKVINKTRQIQTRREENQITHFTQDQINHSQNLSTKHGDDKNVFYFIILVFNAIVYLKFGIVREVRPFCDRYSEHTSEFDNMILSGVFKCNDVNQVEKDFKNTSMFQLNKDKVPKKNGDGNHTEIIKLNNSITYEYAKNEFLKVAGDRLILDTVSQQTLCENTLVDRLEIEKERTKQIEAQELTKQVEVQEQETTKREQIQSDKEIRLAEIELEKLRIQPTTSSNQQNEPAQEIPREPRQTSQIISANQEENIELVKKFINIKTQFSQNRKDYIFIEQLFIRFIEWFHSIYPNTASPLSQTQMSRCIARLPEFIVMRIAIGPRVNNATPRKVGLVNRKWLN